MADSFGALLRATREAAGISLGELAKRINYSKSYLSKIENGQKPPNATLAKLCDRELDTGGTLSRLIRPPHSPAVTEAANDGDVWVMSLDEDGDLRFHQIGRRQLLAGAGAMLGFGLTRGTRAETDTRAIAVLRASFDQYRQLGMLVSPATVLGPVIAHVHTLRTLATDNPEPVRSELFRLASRVAEYCGWMNQEAGDERGALWWTERAVELAGTGRDPRMASYALVRRAELAMYRHDALSTIELARRAQDARNAGPRILGLAARVEAQGHALAGDIEAYQRALDRATDLLSLTEPADPAEPGPVLGSSSVGDHVSLAHGWALCDLGRPAEAAEVLDRHVAAIPQTARRAMARFGARRALAHAYQGEIDHACVLAREVLENAAQVDSATVRLDLRELGRVLGRWRNHGAVRELSPEMTRAMHTRGLIG